MLKNPHNWAGNYTYNATRLHQPTSVAQIQDLVTRCTKLRVLGSRHSFNAIADSDQDLLSLANLERVVEIDHAHSTVTIDGGITYGQLCPLLDQAGYALHNLASLPHISVAGACATGTHGSGDRNGNLATPIVALEMVRPNGEIATISRAQDGDLLNAASVGLGALGIVTKLTLAIVPAFAVQQEGYENLPITELDTHFDSITSAAYSVSLFTNWQGEDVNQVWLKRKLLDGAARAVAAEFYRAKLAPTHRHPIVELSADPCTRQMGIPGTWYERLPHFRIDRTPSAGEELQSEYFVHRQHGPAALRAITQLSAQIEPQLMISEIRTIAADELWMSPAYQRDSIGIHFTWKRNWPAVQQLLPLIEAQLTPFEPRPHWGKLFTMAPAQLQAHYPKLHAFQQLAHAYDPQGVLRNAFLDRLVFAGS